MTWLGNLPPGWVLVRPKALFRERRESSRLGDTHLTPSQAYGVIPQSEYMKRTGNRVVLNLAGQENMKHVEPDDFVIHLRSFQGGIEYSRVRGKVSTAYTVLEPQGPLVPPYFRWLLKSDGYIQELRTTTNQLRDGQSIRYSDFAKIPLPLPPLVLQRAIANYLDHETARIDELIAEQQRLIDLLHERRSAVVAEALGARVGAGERLKWLIAEVDVRAGIRAAELPLMSVSISWGVRRRDEVSEEDARTEILTNYKVCEAGDLVINRMRAFQGALGLAPVDGLVSPDYAVIKVRPNVDPRWLVMAMKTPEFVAEMAKRVKGIGSADLGNARTPRINFSDLGEIRLDVPALTDQTPEWTEMEGQLARIEVLVTETETLTELARERRSALITAAVTGQIDVEEGVA